MAVPKFRCNATSPPQILIPNPASSTHTSPQSHTHFTRSIFQPQAESISPDPISGLQPSLQAPRRAVWPFRPQAHAFRWCQQGCVKRLFETQCGRLHADLCTPTTFKSPAWPDLSRLCIFQFNVLLPVLCFNGLFLLFRALSTSSFFGPCYPTFVN